MGSTAEKAVESGERWCRRDRPSSLALWCAAVLKSDILYATAATVGVARGVTVLPCGARVSAWAFVNALFVLRATNRCVGSVRSPQGVCGGGCSAVHCGNVRGCDASTSIVGEGDSECTLERRRSMVCCSSDVYGVCLGMHSECASGCAIGVVWRKHHCPGRESYCGASNVRSVAWGGGGTGAFCVGCA
jgi:hypothetical protein